MIVLRRITCQVALTISVGVHNTHLKVSRPYGTRRRSVTFWAPALPVGGLFLAPIEEITGRTLECLGSHSIYGFASAKQFTKNPRLPILVYSKFFVGSISPKSGSLSPLQKKTLD